MKINRSIFNFKIKSKKIWVFLFCIQILFLPAQDTLDYGLNDPRNPKCPCHKYQKKADEEFKKLLASADKNSGMPNLQVKALQHNSHTSVKISNSSGFAISDLTKNKYVVKRNFFLFLKHKRKKRIKLNPKLRKFLDVKHWEILKRLKLTDSCFNWR